MIVTTDEGNNPSEEPGGSAAEAEASAEQHVAGEQGTEEEWLLNPATIERIDLSQDHEDVKVIPAEPSDEGDNSDS